MTYLAGKVARISPRARRTTGAARTTLAWSRSCGSAARAIRTCLRRHSAGGCDSLPPAEPRSPVTREGQGKKQRPTCGPPDLYLDDDLFGYMVAIKGEDFLQRDTVLATGTLVVVASRRPDTSGREPRVPGRRATRESTSISITWPSLPGISLLICLGWAPSSRKAAGCAGRYELTPRPRP